MSDDKIKYSDIIEPDDSLERLISQLGELNEQYGVMVNAIRAGAIRIVTALKSASSATGEGRKSIDEATLATTRLERAERELSIAMSETGKEIARVKALTSDQNKATVEQMRYINQAVSSYDRLKSDLKEHVALYKSLTVAERENSAMGREVLQEILNLKNQVSALDKAMKPYTQTLTELQKAQQRLTYLQSEEGKELLNVKAQIKELTKARKEQKAAIDPLVQAQERLEYAQSEQNGKLRLYSTLLREANQVSKLRAIVNNSEEGSYNRLAAQYKLNVIELNRMSQAERQATDIGKKLELETRGLYQQMIQLQEATGNYRLSVGNYQKAFTGLNFSIAQVVREIPAATISLNTFFLAISNNIPMVVDEINNLRAKNAALRAQGEKTVNIKKEIVKGLFSWNTALVVVITALTMFGKEISDWVTGLFKGKNAVLSLNEALQNISEELKTTNNNYGNNIVKLKTLQKEWNSLKTVAEKDEWIKKNQTEFANLGVAVNSVSDAENIFVANTDNVIESLRLRAKAAAAQKLAQEKYEEGFIAQNEAEVEALKEPPQTKKGRFLYGMATAGMSEGSGYATPEQLAQAEAAQAEADAKAQLKVIQELLDKSEEANKAGDAYFNLAAGFKDAADTILGQAGIKEYEKEGKKGKKGKKGRDLTDAINRMSLSVQKKYEQSITDLERDEYEKRKKAAEDAANAKIRELQEAYRKNVDYLKDEEGKYKELTEEEKAIVEQAQKRIYAATINIQNQLSHDLQQIELDRQINELKILNETIQLRLAAVKKGSEEEMQLRLQSIENAKQIAILENKKKPTAERQSESEIMNKFNKETLSASADYLMNIFGQQQELDEAVFNEVKRSEKEITRFKLQQERDRWNERIRLAEEGVLDWTQIQIDAAKSTVEGLNRQLNELDDFWENVGEDGLGKTLLEKLGFDDDEINALTEATDIIIDNIKAIAEAEVEAAEKAVEAAEARTQAAQEAYDAEIEARNNGYANNVADAKRTLQLEQANQKKKQKLLEDAQKRQATLDSISQASSLVTASANIWSAFSKGGPVGITLALAAIAAMWGSFAAAKIKAKQVTSNTQEYGEGGLEFLEGGSHASGNDIDLGVKNKRKRRMKAEGGEALAIINKRQTRRYRRVLPDIISSLNKGVFEDRYMGAFKIGEGLTTLETPAINLSAIENDLSRIRKQHEMQYHTLANGDTVIITGNVKRIIHR